ncbi:hypothetical protein [Natrinema ejinorense]|uniref:Uncharacterized protein n=1 Tax=Natrinema ejinorense TaxID=373386 RepID=A0A2A5QW94_9EURY|nr:hypothetical protein [Natrinema ejinorense]PCR91116.1 hypothetical protein CP557_11615 [Natrinema ejinorense]
MSSDAGRSWAGSQETTNLLLGANIVVLAARFVRLGHVGPWPVRVLSELILLLVLLAAVVLVVGGLYSHE